jgi:methionyl-tRNA formyltransferase
MARIAFLGTSTYGVPILQACIEHHEVVAVVTQPDRFGGRGRRELISSEVKQLAAAAGIPVLQPERLSRDSRALAALAAAGSDLFVLAAYGQILRPNVLSLPPHGVLGVHASLLPRWRSAAPVAAAIRAGDAETGVTLMLTEAGLDTGPVIAREAARIEPSDTTETLTERLAALGATLLIRTLPRWLAGEIVPRAQENAGVTYAPELAKEDGRIEWAQDARQIERHVRAMIPWPGAYTTRADGTRLTVWEAQVLDTECAAGLPGTVVVAADGITVQTGRGSLVLVSVQPAGRRVMAASAFARGQPDLDASRLD